MKWKKQIYVKQIPVGVDNKTRMRLMSDEGELKDGDTVALYEMKGMFNVRVDRTLERIDVRGKE